MSVWPYTPTPLHPYIEGNRGSWLLHDALLRISTGRIDRDVLCGALCASWGMSPQDVTPILDSAIQKATVSESKGFMFRIHA